MTGEQILAMFLGEMGDSVLDIECLLFARLDSARATVVVGMYRLDMLGIAIHLLHGDHKGTQLGDETSIEENPGAREDQEVREKEKGPAQGQEGDNVAYASIFIYRAPCAGSVLHANVRGFAIHRTY